MFKHKTILMNNSINLMGIFYLADEFCKEINKSMAEYRIDEKSGKKRRNKPSRLSDSEVITILVAFHLGGYRNLKYFYQLCTETFSERVSENSLL